MRETFDGTVTMCSTSINDRFGEELEREENYIRIEFNADTENPYNIDSILLYSPKYKGRADIVGKKVRVIVEVDE